MYELKLTIRTDTDPHELLYQIHQDIHEHVNVLGMDYHLISPQSRARLQALKRKLHYINSRT